MFRIILCATLACLAAATVPVAGQGGFPARPTREFPRVLPGTPAVAMFATIQGNALTSTDRALVSAFVRVRNARAGQVVEWQVTDGAGLFVFRSLDPGIYVVEVMGQDEASVLAASQVLSAGAGETVSTIVKLPIQSRGFASLLGASTTSSAQAVTSQAAASGVLVTQISGAATCDTLQ
jgi:hypothetical protein